MNIFETVVYDGRLKEWRIWNICTGSVYSSDFQSEQLAYNAIEHGTERDGKIVVRVTQEEILDLLKSKA
jgi:hypothetical protein